jgi:transposase-like protein
MICPRCGGIAVNNGGIRAVCKICHKSFRKDMEGYPAIKNNLVFGNEEYECIEIIKL